MRGQLKLFAQTQMSTSTSDKGHGANDRGRCEKAQYVGGEEENGVQAVQLK
ncbi:hypothetical protein T12_11997 [Trichinella patagoniensis]|uniref:Uncharacterized protein n=2 Tax=Trichinella TaxID=6333 RepID=A0A0V0ZGJ5_9BILA|nr:hypothetical protein T05_14009 [Trichinella murrelli]KRX73345.1 hypothetical protein T06_16994 [Trichinella sp. T6]KRY11671.1 hypothetical protein T12_11997 [Trichinella patagoniensis]